MRVPSTSHRMHPERRHRHFGATALPGLSLLEMTVVIMVLMSLVTILLFAAQAWKRGSDRATCIIHIQNVQKALRGYSNMNGYTPGENAPDLQARLIGSDGFIDTVPDCPGNGDYSFGATYGPDTIPPLGSLYMECSLAPSDGHVPVTTSDW